MSESSEGNGNRSMKYIGSSIALALLSWTANQVRASGFFSQAAFMPHGFCYLWQSGIVWSHAISDGTIALSYFIITAFLLGVKTGDVVSIPMRIGFAAFIGGCGATHVMDVLNIWTHYYWVDAAVRIFTAIASIGTAANVGILTAKLALRRFVSKPT